MEKKKTIQSIDRAVKILNYISKNGNNSRLVEISNDLEIKKSTLHGILSTLEINGLIYKNPDNSKYSLGIKLYEYGKIYEETFSLKTIVRPFLEKLKTRFNEAVHMAIEDDFHVLYLDRVESDHSMRLASKPGHKDHLYCTAIGKIILASKNDDYLEKYLNTIKPAPLTRKTITTKEELKKEIIKIRENKFSFDDEELEDGLVCIAAPIVNKNNELIAAVGVSGPTNRIDNKKLKEMKVYIPKLTSEISELIRFKNI